MDLMELFNLAVLIAFIYFSAWAFYLKFKANRVTTTRDLLHAFITGGILAVTTMVFGVTGEIVKASSTIKEDTVSIRATLEGSGAESRGETQALPPNEQLAELLRVNQQQTQVLRRLLGMTDGVGNNVDQTRQLLERLVEVSGSNPDIPAKLSGPQMFIQLNMFCTIPEGDETSNCVVVPNER